MKIRFWGVRGSVPAPGADTVVYGGNTPCVSVEAGDSVFIFDAGTGIRSCGLDLMSRKRPINGAIFISHTHWDHIQGFPFFAPSYKAGNAFLIYGPPSEVQKRSLRQIMELQTNHEYFPVSINQLQADLAYVDCKESKIHTAQFEIEVCRLNHPVMCLAYKLRHEGRTFVYGGDHEPFRNVYRDAEDCGDMDEDVLAALDQDASEQNARITGFLRGADLVTWDAQYTAEQYASKRGWGHSWYEADLTLAEQSGLSRLVLTHHDPMSTDAVLAAREEDYRARAKQKGIDLLLAKEGMTLDL